MRRAFTLIEILVVVTIMVLLVATVLPTVKYSLDESKVRESSRQLSSHFSLAKSRAASTGRPCGVVLQVDQVSPGLFQATQCSLAETPAAYSGDVLDARVTVNVSGNAPWQMTFLPAGSEAMLYTLVQQGEAFSVRFDHREPSFPGIRNGNQFFITGYQIRSYGSNRLPPTSDPNGYAFEIIRNPVKIGSPLALPRGTGIDLTYSGFSNAGTEFASGAPLLVMFSPDGHVTNQQLSAIHFLVGRPEKILTPAFSNDSNILDNRALWVTISALTGNVSTSDNSTNANLPRGTAPERIKFIEEARKLATDRDIKGGQ